MTATLSEPQISSAPTPPPNSVIDPDADHRFYIHPRTGERFVSITTALGIIDKGGLPPWYGKMAAESVLNNLLPLVQSVHLDPCGQRGWDSCGRCLPCLLATIRRAAEVERDAAANRGTRFHHVAEQYALTGQIIPHDADIAGNVLHFLRFVDIHKVTFHAAEVTAINRADGYAGTLDAVIVCGWMPPKHRDLIGEPLFTDWKTGSRIYEQAALQLAANRHCEAVMLPDGSEHPMPSGHTGLGLSVQIRPDDFWVRPVDISDAAHTKFRRALDLWRDIHQPDIDLVLRAMTKPRTPKEPPCR